MLERHQGTVEKYVGDAVVGVFGVPRLHEDDALRAVRAAAELGEALSELNKELERGSGVTLRIRVGLNTGEVIVGSAAAGGTLVLGDAVNLAARLEQAAAPGEVLLGQTTWQLVRDGVRAEPVAPLLVKGRSGEVAAWRLLAVTPDAPGRMRRRDLPMVGRERERQLLLDAFDLLSRPQPTGHGRARAAYRAGAHTRFQPLHFGWAEPRLGGSRLYEFPHRVGLSQRLAAPGQLNTDPHPLA